MSGLPDLAGKCLWWMGWGVQRTVFEDGVTPRRRGNVLGHTVECCHCPVKSVHTQDHRRTEERLVIVAIISLSPLYWMKPLTGKGCPSGGFRLCLVLDVVAVVAAVVVLPCAVIAAVLPLQLLLSCCCCSCCYCCRCSCCCCCVDVTVAAVELLLLWGSDG